MVVEVSPAEVKHGMSCQHQERNVDTTSTRGTKRLRRRPDANGQLTSVVATKTSRGRRRFAKIVEVGYTSEGRFIEKLAEKDQQHQQLKDLLEAQGFQVKVIPVILGSTGGICTISTEGLEQMGIDRTRRERLNRKLHHDAITWMHAIVKKRRMLDATFYTNLTWRLRPPD